MKGKVRFSLFLSAEINFSSKVCLEEAFEYLASRSSVVGSRGPDCDAGVPEGKHRRQYRYEEGRKRRKKDEEELDEKKKKRVGGR